MSEAVVERIAAWLVTAIGEITVANGYQQTLTVARPGDLEAVDAAIADLTAIVGLEDPEPAGPRTRAGYRWWQPFGIVVYLVGRGGTDVTIDKRINRVRSDIEKRLGAELAAAAGPRSLCSDLADDIELRGAEIWQDEENQATVLLIRVAILYGVSAASPYTQT